MEDDVEEEIVTHDYQHQKYYIYLLLSTTEALLTPEMIDIFVFQVVWETNPVDDEDNRGLEEK